MNMKELVDCAAQVKGAILAEYRGAGGGTFKDSEYEHTGLISRSQGGVALLLLLNAFAPKGVEFSDEEIDIVRNELMQTLDYVDQEGFDVTPYITARKTQEYFSRSKGRYHYMDSVSWVFSSCVLFRNAYRKGLLRNRVDAAQINRVHRAISEMLNIILESQVPGGGWGFANGCTQNDLYYSYVISEALADFGDYVMGESSEEIPELDRDEELIKSFPEDVLNQVETARRDLANYLVEKYVGNLGQSLINDSNNSDPNHPINLYATYFVIDMLIINKADVFFPEKKDLIKRAVEHALYLTRIHFDGARANKDWFESKKSELRLQFANHPEIKEKLLGNRPPTEPGLVPLSVRCNALYTFYISEGVDAKLNDLFSLLLESRYPNKWLWDSLDYNLQITERAVECMVDFADYLARMENNKVVLADTAGRDAAPFSEKAGATSVENAIRIMVEHVLENKLSTIKSPEISKTGPGRIDDASISQVLISLINEGIEYLSVINEGRSPSADHQRGKEIVEDLTRFFKEIFLNAVNSAISPADRISREKAIKGGAKLLSSLGVILCEKRFGESYDKLPDCIHEALIDELN